MTPAAAKIQCALCGLEPGPGGPVSFAVPNKPDRNFCCIGCANVYAILDESGVLAGGVDPRDTDLFKQSMSLGLIANADADAKPASAKARKLEIPEGAEIREVLVHTGGLWCSACGWLIESALKDEQGVLSVEVMFAADLVRVRYCPIFLPVERIVDRIRSLGYKAELFQRSTGTRGDTERRDLLLRAGIAGFLWMNVMTFSIVFYVSYFEQVTEKFRAAMPVMLLFLTAPAIFYSAAPILRAAWNGLRQGVLRMEALLATGILAAYVYSGIQAFTGGIHFYFDTACAIITLVLLGKLIERSAKQKTLASMEALYQMMPAKARVLVDGRERFISAADLTIGAEFLVKAGERVAVDGDVIDGVAHLDESVVTGESKPIRRQAGDAVLCGSLSTDAPLLVRATRVGNETTLAQLVRSVEEALATKSNLERNVDKFARRFIPAVVLFALATFATWAIWKNDPASGIINAIAVLVIACPCALGLATPLAVSSAIRAAARRGVLVNHAQALETISRVDTFVFDKTGTITHGEFDLVEFAVCEGARWADVLAPLASLESQAEHPLARAVLKEAARQNLPLTRALNITPHRGAAAGVSGTVNGVAVFAGNRALAEELTQSVPVAIDESVARWSAQGLTTIYIGQQGRVVAAAAFGDRLRAEARSVVAELHSRNIRTLVLSGDAEGPTKAIAAEAGAKDVLAQVTPAQKIQEIRRLQSEGKVVAMLGDGINDAPSLAQADLGIAIGSGTALAMRAAPLVLVGSSLNAIFPAIDIAKQAQRAIRVNLFWAFFYNVLGLSLAATGILNPILAAGAMVLSSLSVVANSTRRE